MDVLLVPYHHLLDIFCPVLSQTRALFKAAVDVKFLKIMEKNVLSCGRGLIFIEHILYATNYTNT